MPEVVKINLNVGENRPEVGQRTRSRYASAWTRFADEYNPGGISPRTIEKMERDPELALALKLLKSPLTNADWTIECADPRVRAFVAHAYGLAHPQFVRSALRALERGFNPHEKVWTRVEAFEAEGEDERGERVTYRFENAFIYEKIKEVHPEGVTIIKKDDRFDGFRQSRDGKIVTVQPEKAVVAVWDERDGNKYGRSVFVNAYDDWYKDRAHAGHMMMYLERRGAPAIVVEYPAGRTVQLDGSEKDNGEIALEIGASIQNNSAIAIPSDLDPATRENRWKVYYLKDDARAASFADIHTAVFVPAKLRALFIPDLAAVKSGDGGGAYALGRVHKSVLTDIQEDIIEWFARLVNEHVIPDLVRFNFGSVAPRARLVVQGVDDNTKDLWVEIVRELSKLPEFTGRIDMEELLGGLGVPVAGEKKELSAKDTRKNEEEAYFGAARGVAARQLANLEEQVRRIWRRGGGRDERLRGVERLQLRHGSVYEAALRGALERAHPAGGEAGAAGLRAEARRMAVERLAAIEHEVKRGLIGAAASGGGEDEALRGLREVFSRIHKTVASSE